MEIKTLILDNQILYKPSLVQWEGIFENPTLEGYEIRLVPFLKKLVRSNARYNEIYSCLGIVNQRVLFYELLEIGQTLVRVHIERVVCEHCDTRTQVSATPSSLECYIGLEDEHKQRARARGYSYPNLKCDRCGNTYDRRYTIWKR